MVDEAREHRKRIVTLSESSSGQETDSSDDHQPGKRCINEVIRQRPRKQDIRQLREEIEDDPELYGIRRSCRSRREPSRFKPPKEEVSYGRRTRVRRRVSSDPSSDSSDSSGSNRWKRIYNGRKSVQTRGNRISYKEAFVDEYSSDEKSKRRKPVKRVQQQNRSIGQVSLNSCQSLSFQKPKGPLVRQDPGCLKINRAAVCEDRQPIVKPKIESEHDSDEDFISKDVEDEESFADEKDQLQTYSEDEADTIEEVLSHAIRRVGTVGNSTTLYNSKLEKDVNAGFDPDKEPGELQFLIKWKNWSHIHSTWETEESLKILTRIGGPVNGLKKLNDYKQRLQERDAREKYAEKDELEALVYEDERNDSILSDKMKVERIIAHSRDRESDMFDYLIKWCRLDYRYCTWEAGNVIKSLYPESVEAYNRRINSLMIPNPRNEVLRLRPKFVALHNQPSYLGNDDLRLRDYQLKGMNWLSRAWCRGNSVILADEMGLGKTIQTISFLSYLFHSHKVYGPFLLVVPLSTLSNWYNELGIWAPEMNSIVYCGDHVSRQLIREHEWSNVRSGTNRRQQVIKFNVCLTTYEIVLKDKSWLGQVSWAVLAVDEAHRLKNDVSQLYKALSAFDTNSRLLVTGTPLQNSLKELWALLHFIMPNKFPSWNEFQEVHGVVDDLNATKNKAESLLDLHKTLEPYLLRRIKKDVEKSLPEKIEQILRVNMTARQSNIYRMILSRNYDGLMKVMKGHKASFINILMELKKCCNHAELITRNHENYDINQSAETQLKEMLRGSGKLNLLDKLLQRLKPKGHRVLIFSQMVTMLDIIADYLRLRGWGFQRLDGSIRGDIRKQALDHFNAEGSTDFCFLLSTRAGGLGINLATADIVIIFDSDWNPQNDIQAQARAHRIGQKKQVSVYRFVTADSVEEKVIESATRKMVLDHLVIQRMEASGNKRPDNNRGNLLSDVLRYGAEGLFSRPQDDENNDLDVDIDNILNTAETRDVEASSSANNPANALLSSFRVVTLDNLEAEEEKVVMDTSNRTTTPVKSWDEIIPEEMRVKNSELGGTDLLDLELGPRRRKKVKSFQAGMEESGTDSEDESDGEDDSAGKRKDLANQLSDKEVRALIRAVKRFARPLERIDAITADAELPEKTEQEVKDIINTILEGCRAAMQACSGSPKSNSDVKPSNKGPTYHFGRVAVAAKPLLQSIEDLEILHKCLPSESKEARMEYRLPFVPKLVSWSCMWTDTDDVHLLAGVYEHGYDNWEAIKLDSELGLGSKLLPVTATDRPQASHVRTRVDYLLKMLSKHCLTENKKSDITSKSTTGFESTKKTEKEIRSSSPKKIKLRLLESTKKKTERSNVSNSSTMKLKSAEFIETDDSSSGDEISLTTSTSKKSSKEKHSEHTRSKSVLKRIAVTSHSDNNADESEPKKRKKHKHKSDSKKELIAKAEEPMHFTANREPVTLSDEAIEQFYNNKGPLFIACKEKLVPIKKHLKELERLEAADDYESRKYLKVMLRIGDHIRALSKEFKDKEERSVWKGYFWDFVQVFSKKSAHSLQSTYRKAAKRLEKQDKATGERESHEHGHNKLDHHHSEDYSHQHHDHNYHHHEASLHSSHRQPAEYQNHVGNNSKNNVERYPNDTDSPLHRVATQKRSSSEAVPNLIDNGKQHGGSGEKSRDKGARSSYDKHRSNHNEYRDKNYSSSRDGGRRRESSGNHRRGYDRDDGGSEIIRPNAVSTSSAAANAGWGTSHLSHNTGAGHKRYRDFDRHSSKLSKRSTESYGTSSSSHAWHGRHSANSGPRYESSGSNPGEGVLFSQGFRQQSYETSYKEGNSKDYNSGTHHSSPVGKGNIYSNNCGPINSVQNTIATGITSNVIQDVSSSASGSAIASRDPRLAQR